MPDAIMVNLRNGAVTEYTGIGAVDSACSMNGVLYICDATGIHAMDAGTDNGVAIDAEIATGLTDFGTHYLKRVSDVWLGIRSTGAVDVVTLVDEVNERRYHITNRLVTARELRLKLDRGVRSRYWKFLVRNKLGSDFQLSNITIEPQITTRRVR